MDTRTPRLNTQIYTEACEWFVDFRDREPDDRTRRDFDRWLRTSPEHLSAYLEIAAIWAEAPALDPDQRWTAERLIEATREADAGSNVIPFDVAAARCDAEPPARKTRDRRRPLGYAAAAVGAVVAAVGAFVLLGSRDGMSYDTGVGEQRSVALPDGSTVDLNSRSRIVVRYSDHSRAVELLDGQALFVVAKDPARPFVVTSGNARVHAVGTQFDVYRKSGGTVVTVVEGRVAILGGPAASAVPARASPGRTRDPVLQPVSAEPSLLLGAGSQVLVTDAAIRETAHPNVDGAIAWRQRRLVFDSASLVEVAEEFNRYNTRQLVIDDPGLHGFHISGVFSSTDPASLIRFLRERPEVDVVETASEIRVTKSLH